MNPMTNVKNIQKLNEKVLQMGVEDDASWHKQYKDSAYVFIGGLPYDLTEGDILCVFSQYGEIVDINLVRDKSSGKSKGYGFLCYEDQRSTILSVDNLNGIKLGGRTIRVDHVANYKRPKGDERDEKGERKDLPLVGCAPTVPSSDEEPKEKETFEIEPKNKKKKKEKSKKRTKEKNKGEKDEGEVRARARSPNLQNKKWKIENDDEEFDGKRKKMESSSEFDRDRNRYRGELVYKDRTNVDSRRRREYEEKDKQMKEESKYSNKIEERMKHHKDFKERDQDRNDRERRRYDGKNRK